MRILNTPEGPINGPCCYCGTPAIGARYTHIHFDASGANPEIRYVYVCPPCIDERTTSTDEGRSMRELSA